MKFHLKMLAVLSCIFSANLIATNAIALENGTVASAVASKTTCGKFEKTTQPFILVLNHGDDLLASITQCAKDAKLLGASISGLGQLHNPTLAYFTSNPSDKPSLTTFSGYYELAGINGNITNTSGKYYTHAHAVLADKKFAGIAGHVNAAEVGQTVEITIAPFSSPVERTVNPETGFGPIVVDDSAAV